VDLAAYGRPYPAQYRRDCEDIARARIALAHSKPDEALEILEPVAVRAQEGGRGSQLIEIKLLQALAYSSGGKKGEQGERGEDKALAVLGEAIGLGEGENFIRSFVDEGPRVAGLLSRLRARGPRSQTPARGATTMAYIDELLAAFEGTGRGELTWERTRTAARPGGQSAGAPGAPGTYDRVLVEPLSERELEVLHLLAQGSSNAQIAEQLVLAPNTVKRHMSNIFEKLGASNRTQAVAQARAFGLLHE
jgi:LuxR family maltose regulon positive regulatory protein